MEPIPLVDLSIQTAEVAEDIRRAIDSVIARSAFILGREVSDFEAAYARYCGVAHCFGVGNGGDAIELMLRAFGVGAGDEVILPANTFIATAQAVVRAGASPVLVDCDPRYQLIDPESVAERVGTRTRAIIAVQLFGQIAPMAELREIASKHDLLLFEDAAQCQGARQAGRRAGGLADAAATSFYPGKNLGAFGDAGAVLGDDPRLADHVPLLRDYGSDRKNNHPEIGFNSRLDTLQAAVLLAKLARLDAWNEQRRTAAARYDSLLAEATQIALPETRPGNEHVWHLYVVRVPDRDRIFDALREEGIGVGIHYPTPIHLQGAFATLGQAGGSFPHSEKAAEEILSLPLYPGIRAEQQRRVADALLRAVG